MLDPIKIKEKFTNLNNLVSLQNQVNGVRLQDEPGEQNYHQNAELLYEPLTDTIKRPLKT